MQPSQLRLIPAPEARPAPSWRRSLAQAVRDPDQLIDLLGLDNQLREPAQRAARLFPLLVPQNYIARMQPGNPDDPLLRQVLPIGAELKVTPGYVDDPVDERQTHRAPGLLQKYHGRALLITTGACAVHCRYCFRREYTYGDEPHQLSQWQPAFDIIRSDPSLHEVILSGGDPLMLTDSRLRQFVQPLENIEHVRRLRVHTRLPIVLPDRVTRELIDLLTGSRLTPIMVVHANHPRELQGDCAQSLRQLVRSGITVLNQAVLLKGVNDVVDVMAELCERLIDLGVVPYYVHQLDRVSGAAHFEVPPERGQAIIEALRPLLPGYAVPTYVQELPGKSHKLLMNPAACIPSLK